MRILVAGATSAGSGSVVPGRRPGRRVVGRCRTSIAVVAAGALLGGLLAACTGGGSDSGDGAASDDVPSACTPTDGEKPAKALVRCGERSIAFVENDYGSGTGVVTEVGGDTYVVTNVHVVDPFRTADVTVDGTTVDDVPVAGTDVAADVALLGPFDHDTAVAIPIAPGDDVEKADDVFAVGYPGENPADDRELTVASGIVSRVRKVADFDQTYLQTDAVVASGQSGGPLFDDRGRVVGLTGLSDDDFGYALIGANVTAAAGRIADGKGDTTPTVPASVDPIDGEAPEGGATEGAIELSGPIDGAVLFLPPSAAARTWHLSVPSAAGDVTVDVIDHASTDPLASSASGRRIASELAGRLAAATKTDPQMALEQVEQAFGELDPALAPREVSPGEFTIELDAHQGAEIDLYAPLATGPSSVAWTSDQPLWMLSTPIATESVSLGQTASGVFGGYDSGHDLTVDLQAGQEVQVWARSPQGDVEVLVAPPGATIDAIGLYAPELTGLESMSDSDVGLFGLDVKERMTAERSGTYRFNLTTTDGVPVAWRFTVTDCDDGCDRS